MDSTREERMQQRLRGGAQRQVKDVDFGFMLPAFAAPPPAAEPSPVPTPTTTIPNSLPEVPANPETPQPELPSQPISQTPATATRSRDRSSNIIGLPSNDVTRSNTGNDANTSAKRRKLETDEPPSSSTRSMRSSRSSARKDVYDLPEDEELEQPVTDQSNLSILETLKENVSESGMAETALSPTHLLSEPIESIERDLSNEIVVEEAEVEEDSLVGANTTLEEATALTVVNAMKSPQKPPRPSRNKRKRDEPSSEPLAVDESALTSADPLDTTNDDIEEVLPQNPRRSRRKSALQEDVGINEEEMIENSTEKAQAVDDYEAAVTLKKSRGRRISRNIVASDESIPEDAAPPRSPIAKKKRGRVRQVTSPVQQRQPAPPKSKPQRAEKKNKKQKVREGSPIPVIVHRLTKGPVYDDDDSDAEILNSEIPCATRAGVNAVDVLGQICQELVTAGLETLGDNAVKTQDAAQRLEYKTKMRAVDSFGKELRVRLLEHTINLDNSYSLEKRLREGQRKKLSLREEILRVRAEREKVALRMDGIRIAHEKNSHDAQQREVLNTTVHDIELAVERGKSSSDDTDDGKTNIELMLKLIASEASSASDDGGVLKQIKAFNAFMERAALALEGKKAV
ncbi:putative at hook domain-containing protein [Botrytis fragariae]|uniref:Putative at hook domain-containing protein n=1 Tax=Botrytis fragariae TaxID=1964551 RepID=A0A8H6EMV0_9HELO|nr:putative at hook domain-containing protein [Botrytis fragariae]KAF5878146.1 putative at hook domain-containing protein [Botrytis fragariae]